MNHLKGKVTIIAGGAQGIGRVAVDKFAEAGAAVIVWDVEEDRGALICEEFKSKGIKVDFNKVDTTELSSLEKAAKLIFEKYGRIDILINNAGVSKDVAQLQMSVEQWKEVIDVNLTGVFNCTKAVSPYMVQKKFGRIINTSSLTGMYGNLGQANYAATKSGVAGITKVWARELSRHGVTVNAISPGFVETETITSIPDNIIKSIKEKIPVGRLGSPEDITNAYLFLASEGSSYITGSVLSVDGGYTG